MNAESESNSESAATAYFDSQCNHKRSWGLPEVVIPHPEEPLTLEALYERAEILLGEHRVEMEELLQPLCHEGSVNIDVVELIEDGLFRASAEEEVYHGCWMPRAFTSLCRRIRGFSSTMTGIRFESFRSI
jgi:hypothetical protein